jgi:hypothetical protein
MFGLSFISLGVLGLLAATLQHWNILQHLTQDDFSWTGFRPLALIMAILLMLIGLLAFIAGLVHEDCSSRNRKPSPHLQGKEILTMCNHTSCKEHEHFHPKGFMHEAISENLYAAMPWCGARSTPTATPCPPAPSATWTWPSART